MERQKFQLIFLITLFCVGFYAFKVGDFSKTTTTFDENEMVADITMTKEHKEDKPPQNDEAVLAYDAQEVTVNPPSALSGKSKSEIYKIRKEYVKSSIFARAGYEPSEQVFGAIENGKPWISANVCANPQTGLQGISGPSEEARFINNPTMLVAIEYPFIVHYTDSERCSSKRAELIPRKITYSKDKKEITVTYFHLPFTTNNNSSFYCFNGLNAVDMGYKYAYIDKSKSTYDVDFMNEDNLSTAVHEFQNYIHLGSSCRHEGGCNNGSPRQPFGEFKSNATKYNYQNREIYIKLWKSMPKSPQAPADMTERIILKWS